MVNLRSRRRRSDARATMTLEDVLHEGKDHSGPLLQCFTKPLASRPSKGDGASAEGGVFFELIQRLAQARKVEDGEQAFSDPTVIGLYRSIELEEIGKDAGAI